MNCPISIEMPNKLKGPICTLGCVKCQFLKKSSLPLVFPMAFTQKIMKMQKKIQKLNSRGLARALEVLLHSASI